MAAITGRCAFGGCNRRSGDPARSNLGPPAGNHFPANFQIFSNRSLGSSTSQKENGSVISQQTGEASPTISGFSTDQWIQDFRPAKHCSYRYLRVSPASVHLVTDGSPICGLLPRFKIVTPPSSLTLSKVVGPLGMKDTRFYVPQDKLNRFATRLWDAADDGFGRWRNGADSSGLSISKVRANAIEWRRTGRRADSGACHGAVNDLKSLGA